VCAYEYCFYRAHGLLPRFMWTNGNAAHRWYIARPPIKMFDRWVLLLAIQINYAVVIDIFGLISGRKMAFLNLANDLMIIQLQSDSVYCLESFEVKIGKWAYDIIIRFQDYVFKFFIIYIYCKYKNNERFGRNRIVEAQTNLKKNQQSQKTRKELFLISS